MPPYSQNAQTHTLPKLNHSAELKDSPQSKSETMEKFEESNNCNHDYKMKIVWQNVVVGILYHLAAFYGVYLLLTSKSYKKGLLIWWLILHCASVIGITAGFHRLWAHRSFKAKWPLRLVLIVLSTLAFQFPVFVWARDHRAHHKYCDTDGDPYTSSRGFFFAHMGWLFCRKHPDVMQKGKRIDVSDLEADPIVMFQKRHFLKMVLVIHFLIPMLVPVYFWGENWSEAFYVTVVLRHIIVLHINGLVNSVGHTCGYRPYDRFIGPAENLTLSVLAFGEGWHNYHHVFPWDYKTAELGSYATNLTMAFIDLFSSFGWAYDLKTVPMSLVMKRMNRTGMQGQNANGHVDEIWGWGDENMKNTDLKDTVILKRELKSE